MENELKILKIILRSDLTKNELKTVVYLLETGLSTVLLSNSEMALGLGFTSSNMSRTMKNLVKNQVVAERKGGIYVKNPRYWKATK